MQAANYADITWGIDKVMDRSITSLSLNLDEQPTLVNAIERRQQRPLYPDRNVDELHDLYSRLDIEPIGPTYFQPLVNGERTAGGAGGRDAVFRARTERIGKGTAQGHRHHRGAAAGAEQRRTRAGTPKTS